MEFSTKKVLKIWFIYSMIAGLSNLCGVLIPTFLNSPGIRSSAMNEWILFLDTNKSFTNPVQFITFLIPSILCLLYPFINKAKLEIKLINLPVAYASIGISGWVVYLIVEAILMIIANSMGYEIAFKSIFLTSLLYTSLEAIISFTLSYFLMDLCHKKFFFPKNYPNGEFHEIKGIKHLSIKFLFIINYISVTLFPVIYLFAAFSSTLDRNSIPMDKNILIMLLIIILAGIVISINLLNNIRNPMKLLKDRIKKIQEDDLESKVILLSNDDFGEFSKIINQMTEDLFKKNNKIEEIQYSIIENMASVIEGKDSNTAGHIRRTSKCVKVFVDILKTKDVYNKIPDSFYNALINAAPMHDLGKLYIDDRVLKKEGKFTDEEYAEMKRHSAEGAKVVAEVLKNHDNEEFKTISENVAHYHHEKWNGSGYPCSLKETEIPLEARIMALADVFDALVSKRCYKDSFGFDKSFEIIQESLGSHFDPELGKVFISCRKELENLYKNL